MAESPVHSLPVLSITYDMVNYALSIAMLSLQTFADLTKSVEGFGTITLLVLLVCFPYPKKTLFPYNSKLGKQAIN